MDIMLVDDDRLASTSLKTIIEAEEGFRVTAIGNCGEDAAPLYEKHRPDVVLMDIRMGGMTGLDAAEEILRRDGDAKILFLTTFSDDEYIIRSLRLGAKGYLLKQDFENVIPALRAVYSGQTVFGGDIGHKLPTLLQRGDVVEYEALGVTPKECEMIELVAKGLSNKEIADQLFLSEGTVRNYLSSILDKLDLRDRTQLAIHHLGQTRQRTN